MKWAKLDARSYRYWYREKYKISRVSVDRTDELTDYEFEYEFLQEIAYKQHMDDMINQRHIDIDSQNNSFERGFSMDEDEYNHIADLAESGEEIDFEIPKDAPTGKKFSEVVNGRASEQEPSDFIPVDLDQEFGGG